MAQPITTPLQDQILAIVEEVARLKKENEELKELVAFHEKRLDKHSEMLYDQKDDLNETLEKVANHDMRLNRRSYKLYERRLTLTDSLLVKNKNVLISFSDMGKLQEFNPRTRRQSMTKLGHVYEQFPNKYQVVNRDLGGKAVKLTLSYYSKLIKGGV